MKEINVEKTVSHIEYMALDGTQFKDKKECEKYEESAKCVLNLKYKKYVVHQGTEESIFGHGSEDYLVDVVKISDINAVTIVMQLFALCNPQLNNPDNIDRIAKIHKKLDKAFDDEDCVFIGRGYCEDEFWVMESALEAIQNIKDICSSEK